jgi:uncharacterized protein (TIGR02145 family)
MKKLYIFLAATLVVANLWAQAPSKMTYQAVIRNANNELVTSTEVGMRISILQGSADGTAVYDETLTPTTNANGLVSVEFGGGAGFDAIDWANGPFYIKTETDPSGGTSYSITGVSQLLTVPYALHAKTAETATETDPIFTQNIDITGAQNGDILRFDGDKYSSHSQQQLALNGNLLSITDGNMVTLPAGTTAAIIPVLTTSEIAALTPEDGQTLLNSTDEALQIYSGSKWLSIPASCWPQPTTAYAGTNQTFNNTTTSTTLAANTPAHGHGTGQWSIISGEGSSFAEDTDPNTNFTGQECTAYTLRWSITTSCGVSTDDVSITFNHTPTTANAGPNQIFVDATTSTTLAANTPVEGTGQWSIISGEGGSFADDTDPATTFTGQRPQIYELQWAISTNCGISTDNTTISFIGGDGLTDEDGNTYSTVWFGNQEWMAENLRVTQYNNGDAIPTGLSNTDWGNTTDGAYAIYPHSEIDGLGSDAEVVEAYGKLYNWYAVETGNLCPTGWRVPTDAEWTALTDYSGGESVAGGKLKSTRTAPDAHPRWGSPNTGATNEYGFSALPGGIRDNNGTFDRIVDGGFWWSSTESNTDLAWGRDVYWSYGGVGRLHINKEVGFSVRCVRDN